MMDEIEKLSEEIHKLYCEQYLKDHGEQYWTKGDYSKLEERVKEYDRNIARWYLFKSARQDEVIYNAGRIDESVNRDKSRSGERIIALINLAIGDEELSEECWKRFAKLNSLLLEPLKEN